MARTNLKLAHERDKLRLKTEKTQLRIRRAADSERIAEINAKLKVMQPKPGNTSS